MNEQQTSPAQEAPTASGQSQTQSPPPPTSQDAAISPKSRLAAVLLCWFLGGFGGHRFYVGKIGTAILQLLTLGGFGIWVLIDFIVIIVGAFKDKSGLPLKKW